MDLSCKGVKLAEMKEQIISKWILQMREYLTEHGIDHSAIPDSEIESFYNLYLSFKLDFGIVLSLDALQVCICQEKP